MVFNKLKFVFYESHLFPVKKLSELIVTSNLPLTSCLTTPGFLSNNLGEQFFFNGFAENVGGTCERKNKLDIKSFRFKTLHLLLYHFFGH